MFHIFNRIHKSRPCHILELFLPELNPLVNSSDILGVRVYFMAYNSCATPVVIPLLNEGNIFPTRSK